MTGPARDLHLNVNVLGVGSSPIAWQLVDNPLAAVDLDHYIRVAKIAERGHLDAVFLADSLAPPVPPEAGIWWGPDPIVVLSALAAATDRVGLIGSVSTTFTEPYNLARSFASIDHFSGGRVSWNIVTSYDQAGSRKFGLAELPDREDRYRRAAEFIEIVRDLWDSWTTESLIFDRERNVFADSSRIKPVDHDGEFFRVHGSLQLPRPPQGHPVLFQAGGSPSGLALAAKYANAVFTAEHTLSGAQRTYQTLKSLVRDAGRNPDQFAVLPGISLVLAGTDEEAYARQREVAEIVGEDSSVIASLARLGVELSSEQIDQPVPPTVKAAYERGVHNGGFDKATLDLLRDNPQITPRELARAGGNVHRTVIGGPEKIADTIEEWFISGAADGFNLMFDVVEQGLADFVDYVVPLLIQRGLFRSEYTGATLRDHLGLDQV